MVEKLSRPGSAGCNCTCDEVQWSVFGADRPTRVQHEFRSPTLATSGYHSRRLGQREQQQRIEYLAPRTRCSRKSSARNGSCSTMTSAAVWPSKARSWAARCWTRSARCSRRTPSCAGIGSWSPRNGTTATSVRPVGRPATPQEVVDLILQFARENPTWGYDRIADALANVGHKVSDQTVGNVLKAHGIEPAPERKRTTTWSTFLKAHWDQLAAIDFTTVEVWTKSGLVTYYLLFAMRLATRQVCFLGCTPNPVQFVDGADGAQSHRCLRWFSACAGALCVAGPRHEVHGRVPGDPDGCRRETGAVATDRVRIAMLISNAFSARSKKKRCRESSCSARRRCATPRPSSCSIIMANDAHQGLDHQILEPGPEVGQQAGDIVCRERLGGLLKYYHRQAA